MIVTTSANAPFAQAEKGRGKLSPYVNQGRWVVDCPDCPGAEIAREDGRFVCMSEVITLGEAKEYAAPFPKARRAIESLLAPRPMINRNWTQDETLAQLKRENEVML